MKKNINKSNYVKITIIILPSSKDTIKKKKERAIGWKEVFAIRVADKGLLTRLFLVRKKTHKKSDNQ